MKNIINFLKDRDILIVSCGPSMLGWRELINENTVVVCVKQSILEVGERCDIHIYNYVNLQKYDYRKRPFVIYGEGDSKFLNSNDYDYKYRVKESGTFESSIAGSCDLNDLKERMQLSFEPIWGPGIIYEIIFPLMLHSKVRSVTTIGWDIASDSGQNRHFYDKNEMSIIDALKKQPFSQFVNKMLFPFKERINYYLRKKVNKATMMAGEAELISTSVPLVKALFEEHNIKLNICSSSKWLKNDC